MQTRTNGSKPGNWSLLKVRIIHLTQHLSRIRIDSDVIPIDLVESPVVAVDADESVEVACDVRRLCGYYVCHSRVYIGSLDPLVIWYPLSSHPSKRFLLSWPI